jgi:hypothetical protein
MSEYSLSPWAHPFVGGQYVQYGKEGKRREKKENKGKKDSFLIVF